jgi:hypothetical protein
LGRSEKGQNIKREIGLLNILECPGFLPTTFGIGPKKHPQDPLKNPDFFKIPDLRFFHSTQVIVIVF